MRSHASSGAGSARTQRALLLPLFMRTTACWRRGDTLAKPNFEYQKRQKELEKKKKKEEKLQRRLEKKNPPPGEGTPEDACRTRPARLADEAS